MPEPDWNTSPGKRSVLNLFYDGTNYLTMAGVEQ
jgi:hypothetical protein